MELSVVLSIRNETDRMETVLKEWHEALLSMGIQGFELLAINDGSTDGTGRSLDKLRREIPSLRVVHQLYAGAERAIRRGYELARGRYLLQLDLRGRYEPTDFQKMWEEKGKAVLVIGQRTHRLDSWVNQKLDGLLKASVRLFFGVEFADPIVPFRLMEREAALTSLTQLPPQMGTVNLCLAVLMREKEPSRCLEIPVPYRKPLPLHRKSLWTTVKELSQLVADLMLLKWGLPEPRQA